MDTRKDEQRFWLWFNMPFWTVQLLEMMKQWLSIYCWEYWLKMAQNPTTTSFSCWWWDVEGFIIHRSIPMLSHYYPITNPWIVTGIVYAWVNPTLALLSLDLLRPPLRQSTMAHGFPLRFRGLHMTPYRQLVVRRTLALMEPCSENTDQLVMQLGFQIWIQIQLNS